MKKRLLAIALALMLTLTLTLLPVMTYADDEGGENTQNEIIRRTCFLCKQYCDQEIIRYTPNAGWGTDNELHYVTVKCSNCGKEKTFRDLDPQYSRHTGSGETRTCTTGNTCTKCGLKDYDKLGHDWSEWTSNGDGTHSRTCKRDGCTAVEEGSCDGTATCQAPAKCTVCGAERGEKRDHDFYLSWSLDDKQHWHKCKNCDARADVGYHNIDDNHYCPTCYSSSIPCMDTDNDHKCDGCGKVLTGHTDTDNNHVCDLCGEVLHDLKHIPASAATSRVNGNTEYWYCEGCGKYYADAEAKTEITQASTVIPATGRRPTSTTPAASVSSPKTGDAGVALYAGMAILSLTGCAWLRRKEQ